MGKAIHCLAYFGVLLRANMKIHHADAGRTFVMGFFMLVQNMFFLVLWAVFFGAIRHINGWRLDDVATMYGIIAMAVGISMLLCDGVRLLPLRVADGSIDADLTKPRHPLPLVLFCRSNAASLGDLLSGPIVWFGLGHASLGQLPLLLTLSSLSAVIFLSATLMFYSLAFWVGKGSRFSDQLFEALIIFSTVPQHSQPMGIKVVMFSVLPAGFISIMPVELVREFDPVKLALLGGGAMAYALSAVLVFNAGVKRYVAGA